MFGKHRDAKILIHKVAVDCSLSRRTVRELLAQGYTYTVKIDGTQTWTAPTSALVHRWDR